MASGDTQIAVTELCNVSSMACALGAGRAAVPQHACSRHDGILHGDIAFILFLCDLLLSTLASVNMMWIHVLIVLFSNVELTFNVKLR